MPESDRRPFKYPVGTKVRLTEPITVGGTYRNEQTGETLDRTYIEITGNFFVVNTYWDHRDTPLCTICAWNDPKDYRKLNWFLTNISEEQLMPEPVTLTNPKLTPPAPSQTR